METLDSGAQPFTYEREFIIAYETLPLLWDETHSDYTNKYKRNEALDKLLVVLKKIKPTASVKDVKDKVNTLRSDYRRELMEIAEEGRSEKPMVNKIYFNPFLTFFSIEIFQFLRKKFKSKKK